MRFKKMVGYYPCVTEGEKLYLFIRGELLNSPVWADVRDVLAPTGRAEGLGEMFHQLSTVNLAGRIVAAGDSLADPFDVAVRLNLVLRYKYVGISDVDVASPFRGLIDWPTNREGTKWVKPAAIESEKSGGDEGAGLQCLEPAELGVAGAAIHCRVRETHCCVPLPSGRVGGWRGIP